MKKIICLAIAICMLAGVMSGCGSDNSSTTTPQVTTEAPTEKPTEPEETYGFGLNWPNSPLTKKVPRPATNDIKIEYLDEDGFRAVVSNVDQAFFEAYCTEVMNAGYEVIMMPENGYVGGYDGWEYGIKFEPDDKKMTLILVSEEVVHGDEDDDGTIDPELKEALDAYEATMDEYIKFVAMYNESEKTEELENQYWEYLDVYFDCMDKLNELDTSEMNDAEYEYYLEVTRRVDEKLLDAMA